jgi:uncharacterized Ntn-hydrolase superfamily protein
LTYSMVGHCTRTGMFGVVITSSSIAVGSRCAFARAKVGAVLSQHRTDPRLGPRGLDYLSSGLSAKSTIDALVASTRHHGWRQIAAIDSAGGTAHFSGKNIQSIHSGATGRDCVAIGNIIRNTEVPQAMVRVFETDPAQNIATRLVAALRAGHVAGGELKQVISAALLVVHNESFPYVDLRVDEHLDPIAEIERLWHAYELLADDYVGRACEPDGVDGIGNLARPAE